MKAAPLPKKLAPIVAIGASAGGLEALQTVFSNMPGTPGISFIVLQHLSPNNKGVMAEILSKFTQLPVTEARHNSPVVPNHVYLMPAGKLMHIKDGLLLLENQPRDALYHPIDTFFASLAEDQQGNAIGVILSGTGRDGSRGIKAIANEGGLVLIQAPETATFEDMPKNALNTGLADYTLTPELIGQTINSYLNYAVDASSDVDLDIHISQAESGLDTLLHTLKATQLVDFSNYKPSTIAQCIKHRLAITQRADLNSYVTLASSSPEEQVALTKLLLGGYTQFFRNEEVFQYVQDHSLPQLLNHQRQRNAGNDIRIWVPGCATGEEAYTVAILMDEAKRQANSSINIRIFATDIDQDALNFASTGRYQHDILDEISRDHATHYFSIHESFIEVSPAIRRMVVFARHDLLCDPPFSNIDFICCRNVLNRFQHSTQKKVLADFHYALREFGILLLGQGESTEVLKEHFTVINNPCCLFQKQQRTALLTARAHPTPQPSQVKQQLATVSHIMRAHKGLNQSAITGKLQEDLLKRWAPNCLIISEKMEVLYNYGDLKAYLKRNDSKKISNCISDIVIEELASPLKTALARAKQTLQEITFQRIPIDSKSVANYRSNETNFEEPLFVTVNVQYIPEEPIQEQGTQKVLVPAHFIVILEEDALNDSAELAEASRVDTTKREKPNTIAEERFQVLKHELQENRAHLQATIESLEATNDALQNTNEDLMIANEALHSSNEELLSANQELYIVNSEYRDKIDELTEMNDDVKNILATTDIGILFLDRALLIRKFTHNITSFVNLVPTDVGRPLQHITHSMVYPAFLDDIKHVNMHRVHLHRAANTTDGKSLLIQMRPYTVSDVTTGEHNGVVVTLTNLCNLLNLMQTEHGTREAAQPKNVFIEALSAHFGKVKVLVVDDDAADRKSIARKLAKISLFDVHLIEAASISQALHKIQNTPCDVCLVDYRIDNETALEFVRGAQQLRLKLPTIVLSGHARHELDHAILSADIRDFLNKNELTPLLLQRSIQYAISRPTPPANPPECSESTATV